MAVLNFKLLASKFHNEIYYVDSLKSVCCLKTSAYKTTLFGFEWHLVNAHICLKPNDSNYLLAAIHLRSGKAFKFSLE